MLCQGVLEHAGAEWANKLLSQLLAMVMAGGRMNRWIKLNFYWNWNPHKKINSNGDNDDDNSISFSHAISTYQIYKHLHTHTHTVTSDPTNVERVWLFQGDARKKNWTQLNSTPWHARALFSSIIVRGNSLLAKDWGKKNALAQDVRRLQKLMKFLRETSSIKHPPLLAAQSKWKPIFEAKIMNAFQVYAVFMNMISANTR